MATCPVAARDQGTGRGHGAGAGPACCGGPRPMGRGRGGQLGQSAQLRGGAFPFLCFFVFLFQRLLHFLFATIDFAKLCHWPKQFQRIIGHCHKKIVRLLK